MKPINVLKSKRGIAVENAILFLLVIFALCSLLTMIVLIANYQFKIDKIVLLQDVDLDQIGEEFVVLVKKSDGVMGETLNNEDYYCPIESKDGNYILTVKPSEDSDSVLLYVKTDPSGKVLSWRYSAPNPSPTEP